MGPGQLPRSWQKSAVRKETGVRAGVSKVVQGVHDRVLAVTGSLNSLSKAHGIVVDALLKGLVALGIYVVGGPLENEVDYVGRANRSSHGWSSRSVWLQAIDSLRAAPPPPQVPLQENCLLTPHGAPRECHRD